MKRISPIFLIFLLSCSSNKEFSIADNSFKNGQSITRGIRFSYEGVQVMEEHRPFLDSLATFLKTNQSIELKIESHSSCFKTNESIDLSQARAQSILDFLISHGAKRNQLQAEGKNTTSPIIPCDSIEVMKSYKDQTEAYNTNERTIFTIVKS